MSVERFSLLFAFCFFIALNASASPIRIEGNFDFSGEWRRDADANSVQLGGPQPQNNASTPYGHFTLSDPRAEFRAFVNPAPPLEIYAKVFQASDFFLGEAHAKLRYTAGNSDNEKGFESYFYYREGRLNLGDPILNISGNHEENGGGQGIATSWWLGRGRFTIPQGRWSGEINVHNFNNGFGGERNASGEDNEAYTAKIRHEAKINTDFNIYNELLFAEKVFSAPGSPRGRNTILGADMGVNWKTTSLALQYNFSEAQNQGMSAPDNDVFGIDLRNLILLDRDRTGRVGVNANFIKWGRNYTNFLGRGPEGLSSVWYEPAPIALTIQNQVVTRIQDNVRKDLYTELYWDLPRYDAGLVWRHQDKWGMSIFRNRDIARRNQVEANLKLVYNLEAKIQYTRVLWGVEQTLADFDAQRFIRRSSMTTNDLYASLRLNRLRGSIKIDGRAYNHRDNPIWVSGLEGSYRVTDRITLLGRIAKVWINRPDLWYAEWGGQSIVEPFFHRQDYFLQLQYKPTDNSQFFLEYGQGSHTGDGLSQDGDLLYPGRRTDPRIYTKLEMWF